MAGPGQTVEIRNKVLYVDGKRTVDPPHSKYVDARIQKTGNRDNFGPQKVPPDHYFMMGDNRDNSSDSRIWGQVPEKDIVGKAFAVWMHWDSLFSIPSFSRVGLIE